MELQHCKSAIAGVTARLEEAREAQVGALANAILDEMPGDWLGDDATDEDMEAVTVLARALMARGYRKSAA